MLSNLKIHMSYANIYKNYGIFVNLSGVKSANDYLKSPQIEFDI